MKLLLSRTLAVVLMGATTVSAFAVQLVTNGGFEGQDSAGYYGKDWTVFQVGGTATKDNYFDDWSFVYGSPEGVSAWIGYADSDDVTISQTIDTKGYSAATLTLDLFSDGYDFLSYDFMYVRFGNTLLDKIDLGSPINDKFSRALSYDISAYMDGSSKLLSIQTVNDDSFNTYSWVDNVSIEATPAPVPEPASLLALGGGALALLRRRKTSR